MSKTRRVEKFGEGGFVLRNVEVFQAGTHRGKSYSVANLDSIVRNFAANSTGDRPRLRVPVVMGHSEEQALLQDSGLPAAAWVVGLRRKGTKLLADFADMPQQVARLIEGRRYRTVSAEIYDEPPRGVEGEGNVLRRVALLGGEIRQVKSLEEIPVPEAHSERFADAAPAVVSFHSITKLPDGAFAVFSEVGENQMNREALMALLSQLGVDPARVNDDVLGQIAAACGAGGDQPPHPMDMDDSEELPDPKDDDEKMAFAERAKKFACNAYRQFSKYADGGQKFSDFIASKFDDASADDKDNDGLPDGIEKMSKMSERIDAVVAKAVAKALGDQKAQADEIRKFTEDAHANARKNHIDTFCETRLKAGKILPAELDGHNPANLRDRLYRADSKTVVRKFSEKGKQVQQTELDLQMAEIDARSPRLYGDRVRQAAQGSTAADAEVEKVERFAETEGIAHVLSVTGRTPADFVEGFKKAQKANPKLTAEQYGVAVQG